MNLVWIWAWIWLFSMIELGLLLMSYGEAKPNQTIRERRTTDAALLCSALFARAAWLPRTTPPT